MGSRLKGRVKKVEKPDWRVHKLVVYGVVTLAVLVILWYLYLWEWNPDKDFRTTDGGTTETNGGKKP